MVYVTRVESNLKCGASASLAEKVLVVGPNGAGKSALVNGVEAALSGVVSDVAGRQVVASDALIRLLCPPNGEGRSRVVLSDGSEASFVLGEGRASRAGTLARFPLREIYEHLLGNADTAQKWLLRQIGVGDLPDKVETLAKLAREAQSRANALREAATAQAGGLRPEYTAEEIARIKAASGGATLDEAEKTLAAAESTLTAAQTAFAAAESRLAATPSANLALVENGAAILKIIQAQIDANATTKCGLCTNPTTADALKTRASQVKDRIATQKAVAEARADAETAVRNAQADLAVAQSDARRALAFVEGLRAAAASAGEPAEVVRVRTAWDAVRKLRAQAEEAETNAAALKAKTKTAKEDLARDCEKARQFFVEAVQRFLPPGDVFGLKLDPVRFGLVGQDGQIRAALSGAEWARVTAAMAAACVKEGELSVVIPEERAFDPWTLAKVMEAFGAVPAQVIITSPVKPAMMPSGWLIVEVSGPNGVGTLYNGEPVAGRAGAAAEAREIANPSPIDPRLFDDDPIEAIGEVEGKPDPDREALPDVGAPPVEPAKPEKAPRRKKGETDEAYTARTGLAAPKQRGKKAEKGNGHAEPAPEPRRSLPEAPEGTARAQAAAFCAECDAEIFIGTCAHGVTPTGAQAAQPVIDPHAYD